MFIITFLVIQAALLIRSPLFIIRELFPTVIPQLYNDDNNQTRASLQPYSVFALVVGCPVYTRCFFEALIIGIYIYKFLSKQPIADLQEIETQWVKEIKKNKPKMLVGITILSIMVVHSLSVPLLGAALELHGRIQPNHAYIIIYWILDIIKHIYDVSVCLLMLLATIVIVGMWSDNDNTGIEEEDSCTSEPRNLGEYLEDRKAIDEDHKKRAEDYLCKGRKAKIIMEIFQVWFIIPWIAYSIGSALKIIVIIRPWKNTYDIADMVYSLLYNLNQLFFLILIYLCAKTMNTKHLEYITELREKQISKYRTASRMALANLQKIEKDDSFDFLPRIWGTSIEIELDDPFYILILLLNIFFTVI